MMHLINVFCPHCGARGQIALPPFGALLVGPCPECQGMVVVFGSQLLALDAEIMQEASVREKERYLLEVLTNFLGEQIDRLFESDVSEAEEEECEGDEWFDDDEEGGEVAFDEVDVALGGDPPPDVTDRVLERLGVITEEEVDTFRCQELRLIDSRVYFKAVVEP